MAILYDISLLFHEIVKCLSFNIKKMFVNNKQFYEICKSLHSVYINFYTGSQLFRNRKWKTSIAVVVPDSVPKCLNNTLIDISEHP